MEKYKDFNKNKDAFEQLDKIFDTDKNLKNVQEQMSGTTE